MSRKSAKELNRKMKARYRPYAPKVEEVMEIFGMPIENAALLVAERVRPEDGPLDEFLLVAATIEFADLRSLEETLHQ